MDFKEAGARERVRFIDAEIDLSMTFLKLAATEREMGEPTAVNELISKARLGYDTAARFLPQVESAEERQRLESKHDQLGQAILAHESP